MSFVPFFSRFSASDLLNVKLRPAAPGFRPHVLGVDDAPFDKRQPGPVPIVGVVMEGADRVESVALGEFPVDGEGVTEYLVSWIGALRSRPALQAVILGGVTIAGLGIVDAAALADRLALPVLIVTRHDPAPSSRTRSGRRGSPTGSRCSSGCPEPSGQGRASTWLTPA